MTARRRNAILAAVKGKARKLAADHPDRIHPCIWLVEDAKGSLRLGSRPRLPVGTAWPRIDGQPLAYLLSIPAQMLPEWSPLPRDAGHLLLFVGFAQCQVVMVRPDAQTQQVDPPHEEYLGEEPSAGELVNEMRFRLEEGLHAGLPPSFPAVAAQGHQGGEDPYELEEELRELNKALQPKAAFGRLFGHHQAWTGIDAQTVLRSAYLCAHGHAGARYEDLNQPIDKLQSQLKKARANKLPVHEPVPPVSQAVLQAVQAQVAAAEAAIAQRQGTKNAKDRKAVQAAAKSLSGCKAVWQNAPAGSDQRHQALCTLLKEATSVVGQMEQIPTSDDPAARKAYIKALRERRRKEQKELNDLMRAAAKAMDQTIKMWQKRAKGPAQALSAPSGVPKPAEPAEKDRLKAQFQFVWDEMGSAEYRNDTDAAHKAWKSHEKLLNEHALELAPKDLCFALRERIRIHQRLQAREVADYEDPNVLSRKIGDLKWWQADEPKHQAELAHWRPLFVLNSDDTPYFWGDAGSCIILADERQIAAAKLGRLYATVDIA